MTIDLFPTLHFLPRPGITPGLLTFVRASTATRINALGRVESVAANALRHNFDQTSGAYLGWLIEEGRTNMLQYSRDLGQSPWTWSNSSAVRTATGLDGTAASATLLSATAANGSVWQAVSAASTTWTLSVDLRRSSGSGAVSLTLDGGATWIDVSSQLSSSRYTRVSLSQTLANPTPGLRLTVSGDAVMVDFAQLEAGTFATSRIPTTSAPLTRNADLCTIAPGSDGWFNPDQGTVYIEASVLTATTTPKNLFSSLDAPDAVESSVNDPAQGIAVNCGAIGGSFTGSSPSQKAVTLDQPFRYALGYSSGGGASVHGGSVFQSFASGSSWDTTSIAIGHQLRGGAQRFLNGHLRHFAFFPRRLSNDQLVELTTL